MTYTRPFITRRFVAHAGDARSRQLALAVRVKDDFTGKLAEAPLQVFLKELRQLRILRNQSGVFCFEEIRPGENIPPGDYTLVVEPDPTTADWFYLKPLNPGTWSDNFERPITLPLPNPQSPLATVTLSPKTSYPFPSNATLVRGTVTGGAPATGIGGAVVRSTYDQVDPADSDQTIPVDVETQTDRAGEYVLFFQKLPDKTQHVNVIAAKDGQQVQLDVDITEGNTLIADPLHLP